MRSALVLCPGVYELLGLRMKFTFVFGFELDRLTACEEVQTKKIKNLALPRVVYFVRH